MDAIGGVKGFLFPVYVDLCSFSDDERKSGLFSGVECVIVHVQRSILKV